MIRCQQCGHENQDEDTFCANCGTRLNEESRTFTERPDMTAPAAAAVVTSTSQERPLDAADDDWRMTSLGPPPQRKRRRWLWVLIGLLLLCVVLCVAAGVFLSTEGGQEWFEGIATEAAERATESAR